ncbi:hypothetical protein [Bacteroides sp. 519]|nr:hypothetical protein [Bacteroides sp. 519]
MKTRTEISIRNNIVANLFSHKIFNAARMTVAKHNKFTMVNR